MRRMANVGFSDYSEKRTYNCSSFGTAENSESEASVSQLPFGRAGFIVGREQS